MESTTNNDLLDKILKQIANFGWWLYVKVGWRKNLVWRDRLNAEVRDSLGYFLENGLPKP